MIDNCVVEVVRGILSENVDNFKFKFGDRKFGIKKGIFVDAFILYLLAVLALGRQNMT